MTGPFREPADVPDEPPQRNTQVLDAISAVWHAVYDLDGEETANVLIAAARLDGIVLREVGDDENRNKEP